MSSRPLKVLVGCETSGIVRRAFLDQGHDAWSCDLLPADDRSNRHMQCDVRDVLDMSWDLLAVMHPPCTRLCNSGVRWLSKPPEGRTLNDMWSELDNGAELFSACWNAPVPRVAIENLVMHRHAKERIENYQPFAQSVQPWQFGRDEDGPDNEKKRTCFWLRGLPTLTPTGTLDGTTARDSVFKASPGPNRWKTRSKFFPGLAAAMACQWGSHATEAIAA
ncbi:hypothetical protein [Ruegeria sp. A3M17]|uniref:hypothetical protein n=1 Tax=Ruegeria sp. A3M17 TaxID=2267229 RepID=UPI000DE96C20|nr:hypothetical protein [Ruegeria sp. A3M17]RBW63041.1 hypothetical protein DS906_01080 [Ruegeria sp. A3M17]